MNSTSSMYRPVERSILAHICLFLPVFVAFTVRSLDDERLLVVSIICTIALFCLSVKNLCRAFGYVLTGITILSFLLFISEVNYFFNYRNTSRIGINMFMSIMLFTTCVRHNFRLPLNKKQELILEQLKSGSKTLAELTASLNLLPFRIDNELMHKMRFSNGLVNDVRSENGDTCYAATEDGLAKLNATQLEKQKMIDN